MEVSRAHLSTALTLMAAMLLLPPVARSQGTPESGSRQAVLGQITTLNQEAMAAFDTYAFNKARSKLENALQLAADAGIRSDPALVESYLLLGVAYVSGSNDLYRGLHYFVRALRLDRKAKIPTQLATPQLSLILKKARQTLKAVGKPPRIRVLGSTGGSNAANGSGTKTTGKGLIHSPIDTAKRGYPIPVKTETGVDIQAQRIFLFYRPAGTVKFSKIPMKKSRGVYRAAIPAEVTKGRYLHYYIEAQDHRGRLAGSMGSAGSPNVVIIK